MSGQVFDDFFIRFHQAGLGPHFDRHIGDGQALVHGQAADGISLIFDGFISGAGVADGADGLQ
jgi:hypothetical protein